MRKMNKLIFILIIIFVTIPLAFAGSPVHVSVMTFNLENGGTQVSFNNVALAVKKAGADIVGIQEAWGNTPRLAKALRWKYYNSRQHIVSRFPLFEAVDSHGLYVFVEIRPGEFVAMANMHLPDEPYGPDLIKKGIAVEAVIDNERKVRLPTALPFITKMTTLAKQGIPVFLTGDFNSPSDLDWSASTVNVLRNHRYAVAWPVVKTIEENGLRDSYRKIHPNPVKEPSFTWPAMRPIVKNSIDGFNPSLTDLPDRIDFIFSAGLVRVVDSQIVGEANNKDLKISVSPWPSDHRAVVSRFEVIPAAFPRRNLTPVVTRSPSAESPVISVDKHVVHPGEAISITWNYAPGNRYDYVRISRAGSNHHTLENAPRLYTQGEVMGSVKYALQTAKGNLLDWYKSDTENWPLKSGIYDIKLVEDDGYTVLAATTVIVD
jgi:endonuclease/exonuclease/phosphatase family metal-dependent hydrolase